MPRLSDVIAANKPVFTKLGAYSVFMFAASLGTFFAFRSEAVAGACVLAPNQLSLGGAAPLPPLTPSPFPPRAAKFVSSPASYDMVGLVACVLVVNACIAGYVWMAFTEADEEPGKRD